MSRCVVGLTAARGRRILHDYKAYGGLALWRRCVVRGVLLGGVFATAIIKDTGDKEHKEQYDIAGHQDDEVKGNGVNLQVEFHKTHDAASYLARI